MNTYKFHPRSQTILAIISLVALFVSACQGGAAPAPTLGPVELAQTQAAEMVAGAQATRAVRDAQATAEAILGDAQATAGALVGEPIVVTPAAPAATTMATSDGGTPTTAGGPCQDGEPTGNDKNDIQRTPVGDMTYATVQEVSKPGEGFGDFDRWVMIVGPLGNDRAVFVKNVNTIHELRYCGTVDAVKNYASLESTHMNAMRVTAANAAGEMPPKGQIPVVYVDPAAQTVTFLFEGTDPKAPTLDEIRAHIEVVAINP